LAQVPELPHLIEEAERRLAAARDAGRVAEMPGFSPLSLPKIDLDALGALLASRGLSDLDAIALARVQDHLTRLGRGGETWVGQGMGFADQLSSQGLGECPFCAQNLAGSPVLAHYRAYFGDGYNLLKREITEAARAFRAAQDGDVPAAFERIICEAVEQQSNRRSSGHRD
jgi:wobble nucleotide-excising tRNase